MAGHYGWQGGATTQGLIRRIGTGEITSIWGTNWLPCDGLFRPMASTSANPPQMVSELIDGASNSWNLYQLQANLLPMDQEIIASIPLSTRRQHDFWAWHYEKSGIFTVRSAYRMLAHNREKRTDWIEHNTRRSNISANQKDWTDLWKVKIPSKVRLFLWRLAHHSIPTGDVRHHRGMATTNSCSICGARAHGGIHCWSATSQGVCGHYNEKILLSSSVTQETLMLADGFMRP